MKLLLLGALLLSFVMCSACKSEQTSKDAFSNTLQLAITSPRSIDPNLVSESEGGLVVENCFEGLFIYGQKNAEVHPGVAESFEVSSDQRVWTFHLRESSKWSDGVQVTAEDFRFSWLRLMDPRTGADYASIMKLIEGAEAFTRCLSDAEDEGSAPEAFCATRRDRVGLKALNERTLQVTLSAPYPLFKELTAFYAFLPVPKHVLTRKVDGEPLGERSRWATPEHWVSNGPYVLKVYEDRVRVVLEKNPAYWDRDAIQIERVILRMIEDVKARFAAYSSDQLDLLENTFPSSERRKRWATGSRQLRVFPQLGVYMLVFNVKVPPFNDVRVRRALNMALDKSAIVKFVTGGGETPATVMVPSMLSRLTPYEKVKGDTYDPEGARRLLAEAGYPNGKGLGTIVYSYNTSERHRDIAEAAARMWKQNLGLDIELANKEWKVYLDDLKAGKTQLARYGWIADYVDPMTFLDLFESDNPNNSSRWSDPLYDELIQRARVEADPTTRYKLLHRAEVRLTEEMPALPVYYYSQQMLIKPRLSGIEHQLLGTHLFRYLKLGTSN